MIIVIEDDRDWEDYYKGVLGGYNLECFHDGVEAINRMDEICPDLVILDVLLTGPTGFSVLNEMQSYPELAKVPVVIVSSIDLAGRDLSKYGVVAVFDKATMHPRELLKTVKTILVAENKQ